MKNHPPMRRIFLWILGCFFLSLSGCGSGGGSSSLTSSCQTTGSGTTAYNILPLYLGTSGDNNPNICGSAINNPCTDVTICDSSGSNCQTISNILVDTGSSGLRIFQSALSTPTALTPVTISGSPVGECEAFGNGTYGDWGPLVYAQVKLSGEPTVTLPIQLIDPTYAGQYTSNGNPASSSAACGQTFTPDTSPLTASFNGILGVGLFVHSCGTSCTKISGTGVYFTCNSSTCTGTTLPVSEQDQNPVALFQNDNQGVVVSFASTPITSSNSCATGSLILGIGTQSDNTPASGVKAYEADSSGNFQTTFQNQTYSSSNGFAFIDSGSDGYFFPDSSTPPIPNSGSPDYYYMPSSPATLNATIASASGTNSNSTSFNFTIQTPPTLGSGFSEGVIPNLGFDQPGGFDWGLPFFFLKQNVYVGINGQPSTLGTGPYWAF